MGKLVLVVVVLGLVVEGQGFCWKPNINPFMGSPQTERVREEAELKKVPFRSPAETEGQKCFPNSGSKKLKKNYKNA